LQNCDALFRNFAADEPVEIGIGKILTGELAETFLDVDPVFGDLTQGVVSHFISGRSRMCAADQ
jgi:hypothetical protein